MDNVVRVLLRIKAYLCKMATPGSYELEIVKEPVPPQSIQIECPVCLSILREPYQATCCGYSFCKACIERVRASTRTCPCCVARNFRVFEDKRLKRSLYLLKVHCTHKKNGECLSMGGGARTT